VNANDATLTALTTAQTGSTVEDTAPNAPANPDFDLILGAAPGSALGSSGTGSRRALKPARPGHTTSGQRAPGAIPAAMAHPPPSAGVPAAPADVPVHLPDGRLPNVR
jgi:hypothetical protein